MDEQFHIIITADKGNILRLPCSRKKFQFFAVISAITLLFLVIASIFSLSLATKNRSISKQMVELQEQLRSSAGLLTEYKRRTEEQQLKNDLKMAKLELSSIKQASAFSEEKDELISNAVMELNERSELIEKIVGSIGIKLPEEGKAKVKNSGGPFINQPAEERDELLYKADRYLNAIRYLPLGRPIEGRITSRFGKRKDPLNSKKAFHTGIDFKGRKGEKIFATAEGVVKKAFRNGGHGNYIQIDHGNGYKTSFSHMQAYLVRKGDQVERGQLIGLVGNTGRSTGAHLHYEVSLDGKPINPYNFMKVAKLSATKSSTPEKK